MKGMIYKRGVMEAQKANIRVMEIIYSMVMEADQKNPWGKIVTLPNKIHLDFYS